MYRFDNPILNKRETEVLGRLLGTVALQTLEELRSAPYEMTIIALMQARIVSHMEPINKKKGGNQDD